MRGLRYLVVAAVAVGSFVAGTAGPAAARSPKVTEYGGLADSSVPVSITSGPDGRMWYADYDNRVGAITTSGVVSEYPLSHSTIDIAAGPGGAVWAVGDQASAITRITTSGTPTDFPMPATGADPGGAGIAAGPDGTDIWYTRSPGVVGRMTTAGAFTEFTVPLPDPGFLSYPTAITAGPDGAVWFVERFGGGRVGRVTTAGEVTMFDVVTGEDGDLRDIVAGPDGNLWVIDGTSGSVGRITTAGAASWFPLPAADGQPNPIALTRGPDNNLWAAGSPSLWKISTSGVPTEYEMGFFEFAAGVAGGPDGRVWYTQPSFGPRIGAITVGNHPYGEFTSLTPSRVLDTRTGLGRGGVTTPLGPNASFDVQVTGQGGVPASGVSAVVLNVTVTEPTAGSFVSVWPTGTPRPNVSNVNFGVGQTIANHVTVAVGQGGRLSAYNGAGSAHVVFDVVGYYSDGSGPFGARFKPLNPARLFDTRPGPGDSLTTPIGAGGTMSFKVTGAGGVPSTGVTGVVMNVTVADSTQGGFLTVFPGDVSRPLASSLNFPDHRSVPNLVTVRVPSSGNISFFNAVGQTHVLADVVGYYTADVTTNEGRFVPLPPVRSWDTRVDGDREPVGAGSPNVMSLMLGGWDGIPRADVGAAVLNVTVTESTTGGYLTVFPDELCQIPFASNLNFVPGQSVPNQVVTRLSPELVPDPPVDCQVVPMGAAFFNALGTVHVITDVFGYFTNARYADYPTPANGGVAAAFDLLTDEGRDRAGDGWVHSPRPG